jgi:hypothetical protein
MTNITMINPFYAARLKRVAPPTEESDRPVYARLPRAPITASPLPHLTSLYHFDRAGEYGDRRYPGNCGGNLIRDLLLYFHPEGLIFDPMSGSGTCRDVCEELASPVWPGISMTVLTLVTRTSFPGRTVSPLSGAINPTGGRKDMEAIPVTFPNRQHSTTFSAATGNSSAIAPGH